MPTITDALVKLKSTGRAVLADCFGNNAALLCPACNKYPVLVIARKHQRGSAISSPCECRNCGANIYIADDLEVDELTVINIGIASKKRSI